MDDDQQFCLRWNNHQSTLVSVFDTLLENGTLVDCTLAAEGNCLNAHKVVLSACSPFFEALLSRHYDKHPILILKDVKFQELKAMMDYMYRGEVNISQDQLGALLKAAESLQIKGLSDNRKGGETERKQPSAPPAAKSPQPTTLPKVQGLTIEQRVRDDNREGSQSPGARKKKRMRRKSEDLDNHHDASNSSESHSNQTPAQNIPPMLPASKIIADVPEPVETKSDILTRHKQQSDDISHVPIKQKLEETHTELMLEPKSEYVDEMNEDSIEDLTLDEDDMSNMESMDDGAGPSHGNAGEGSSQGFGAWHMGNQSQDEVFLAAQEAVGAAHRDSQERRSSHVCYKCQTSFSSIELKSLHKCDSTFVAPMDVKEKRYSCPDCKRVFNCYATRYSHVRKGCSGVSIDRRLSAYRQKHVVKQYDSDNSENSEGTNAHNSCPKCKKIFKSEKTRRVHERKGCTGIDRRFIHNYCPKCDTTFETLKMRAQHKCDNPNSKYTCLKCKKIFKSYGSIWAHLQRGCNSEYAGMYRPTYVCMKCQETFRSNDLKNQHKCKNADLSEDETAAETFSCSKCNKVFKSYASQWAHIKRGCGSRFLGGTRPFHVSEKIFKSDTNSDMPEETEAPIEDAKYSCPNCKKVFNSYGAKWAHMKKCRENIENNTGEQRRSTSTYICYNCQESFTSLELKAQHHCENSAEMSQPEESNEEDKFACPKCNKQFKYYGAKKSHMKRCGGKRVHNNTDRRASLACYKCQIIFTTIQEKSRHRCRARKLTRVMNGGEYSCNKCSKVFNCYGSRWAHMKRGCSGEFAGNKFPCRHCHKVFKSNSSRYRHMRDFCEKDSYFNCPFTDCSYVTKSKTYLTAHMKIHICSNRD